MPAYKEMYLKMFGAFEDAISILIEAQRECEELYIANPEPTVEIVPFLQESNRSTDGKKASDGKSLA